MYDTLLLSGGGAKGYSFLGIIKFIEENSINISTYGGTSIGSLFAFLMAIGLSYNEIYNKLKYFMYTDHHNIDILNFLQNFGLDDFTNLNKFINNIINKDINTITFDELYKIYNKKLCINALCINDKSIHYFNVFTTPNMPILTAISASMAIPLLFAPVKYNNYLYVDAGIFENFMITHEWFFNKENVLAIQIEYNNHQTCTEIIDIYNYMNQLVLCLFNYLDKEINTTTKIISIKCYQNFLILDVSEEDKLKLIDLGYQTIKKYMN